MNGDKMTTSLIRIIITLSMLASPLIAGDATLYWDNGDSLSGALLTADEKTLTWRSPMFADPLQIELSYLTNVTFPRHEATQGKENEFTVQIWNGDSLSGQLTAMTATTMSFKSTRFGMFEIARSQIRSLQRAGDSGVIFSGLRGMKDWQAAFHRPANNNGQRFLAGDGIVRAEIVEDADSASDADSKVWSEQPDGSLITKKADAAIFLPLELPDKYEIEFEVRSTKPVGFLMAIGRNPKYSLRIETWVDVLVAAKHSFQQLKLIGEKDLSVHLYAFVDQTANIMQVYGDTGEKLGEISTKGHKTDSDGLMFRNGDFDLTIHRLRVNHWDGKTPRIVAGKDSRVDLADGTSHFGNVEEFDTEGENLLLTVEEKSVSVPIAEVASLIVSRQSSDHNMERGSAWLRWQHGGFVSGSLLSISDETILLKTNYATEPLQCSRADLAQIGLSPSTPVEPKNAETAKSSDDPDRLFHEHGTLQGRLVVEGAADAPIQWTPLGGLNASTLQGVENARFVRAADVMHLSEDTELQIAFPDVLYLKNNDVLPCRVTGFNDKGIQFKSPLTDVLTFSHEHIRAIELTAAGRIHQSGFSAEGWKGFSVRSKRTKNTLDFRGNIHYSHPAILTGDTVRFRLEWPLQSWASLTVSMFGTGERDDESCTHICFGMMPNAVQVLDRPMQPNQMMMGMQMGGARAEGIVAAKNSQADIQLVAHDGHIAVSIDGKPAKSIKMNTDSTGHRGIAFNANVTAVGRQVVNGRAAQRSGDTVTLTNFEVDNLTGASIRQFIEEESRLAALTIPRFRRDSPPTHVLIAPNGDLLRGRLLGIEGDTIVFESRLETLRFARGRVGAIVWLDPPKKSDAKSSNPDAALETIAGGTETKPLSTEAAPAAAVNGADGFADDDRAEGTLQAQLADGFSLTMTPLRLVDGRIEGSSTLLGNCSFPARAVRELCTGNPQNSQRLTAYDTWVTKMAREPDWDIPQSDGGNSAASALIGTTAPDFELPMLDGTTFRLSDHRDKIVVLDFWATWCGPCVMALPDYIAATSKFDESKVIFVAVNLQESSDEIRTFLAAKNLSPRIALDRSAAVAPTFQVSGIPHTVILGPGKVIEDVHVGYQPGSGETMQTTIQQLLDGTWKRTVNEENVE